MIIPDSIVKSNRKTLSLCVMKDGKIVVHAPVKLKESEIEKFIVSKQAWLENKIAIISANRSTFQDVIDYKTFMYLGVAHKLKYDQTKKIIIGDENHILIPTKYDKSKLNKAIKQWYITEAKTIIKNRSGEISKKLNLYPTEIKITDSKGRWGSCNSKNIIAYNWRLVMLEPDIVDYVIVHELCHMIEFNHSKRFWELVCAILPQSKQIRQKLKQYSFLLEMFKNK